MIVVYPWAGGFRWKMIGADGAVLVYFDETIYPSDKLANTAACKYRTRCWTICSAIERMAGAF